MAGQVVRSNPLPLWAQIVDDLRRRLLAGEFERRFPTDEELTGYYDVSRQTVREAVRHLAAEGLVVRERGRGSSVTPPVLEQPLHALYSLASTLRAGGLAERSEVLAADRRPVPAEVAAQLGIAASAEAVFVERLRFADDEPIAHNRSWLPAPLATGLLDADLTSGSLYELLAGRCGVRITGGWERIRLVLPEPTERALLRLPATVAAFSVERLVRAGQAAVEWRSSLIRGDRYSMVTQWPAGTQPGAGRPR
ncbi:MAG: GntR family transcriptional regulator [Cellulomonas sp.]|nr:GntR family transcriptional regulator [Cellulomonas sp.]